MMQKEMIIRSQELVIDVFKELREELMGSYGKIAHVRKDDGSPVTEFDVMVEERVKARLLKECPGVGFHGEETGDVAGVLDATWYIDPIDGTSSFIHGLPYCSNMAGLVVGGETVAAVIYHFATDELYTAIRGEGAYRNGERLHVDDTPLDNSLVFAGSFAYRHLYEPVFAVDKVGVFAPLGASGYEFTRLAQGNIQGVTKLRGGSLIHDTVPGVLIAQEAGARVVSFEEGDYTPETLQFVVATPTVASLVETKRQEIERYIKDF